jgi:hypothetical protein
LEGRRSTTELLPLDGWLADGDQGWGQSRGYCTRGVAL